MESVDRNDEKVVDRETLLAYAAPGAPPDLADRVLAGLRERKHPRRARWMLLAASLAVVAAVGILLRGDEGAVSGRRVATVRESIAIGARAVAVAEAGAELSWNVTGDGRATVEQRSGDVFYRVEPGSAFVVRLPGATIRVLGTCFRVEVTDGRDVRSTSKLLVAGGVGATLSAAVLVTVFEGEVVLENPRGRVELGPGEQGGAAAGTSPAGLAAATTGDARTSVQVLQRRVRDLEQKLRRSEEQLAATQPAQPDGSNPRKMFEAEQRDPSWAAAQERRVEERLTRFVGVEEGRATVECRRTCCQITLDIDEAEAMEAVHNDLQTDVGLNHFGRSRFESMMFGGGENGLTTVDFCLNPEQRELGDESRPDRGLERDALLSASRQAVEACMAEATAPLVLTITLSIDESGTISNVDTDAEPLNHPASECIERAVLAAARFAPSDIPTSINVRLHLDPP
jgi:FecR protein